MKTWLKYGLIFGLIGAITGVIRFYFRFKEAFTPIMDISLIEGLDEFIINPLLGGVYMITFIQWFVFSFIIGILLGLAIQKYKK